METPDAPRYRVPDDIAWIDGTEIGMGEELYLARLPTGDTIQFTGTARMMWHAAITHADPTQEVARLVDQDVEDIRGETESFIGKLTEARLVELVQRRRAEPTA